MMAHDPPESKLNVGYVLRLSLVAAFGGFLFGYDTAVIAGANKYLEAYFALDAGGLGFATGVMLLGCMAGVLLAGPAGDRLGRRTGLLLCGLGFGLSSYATAIPESLTAFWWARFAGGIAIGAVSILSPIYIAEIAPERIRGRLVALYQLAIVVGIAAAFFVNSVIQGRGDADWNTATGWRWMFAALIAPSAAFMALLAAVPESPRWLVKAGRRDAGRTVLERIGGAASAARGMAQIEEALTREEGRWSELLTPRYFRPLILGATLAVLSQLSGINAIMYYAPKVFEAAGTETSAAFWQTVIVGLVNFGFTFVSIALVDRLGRKPLLAVGTAAQAATLAGIGFAFHLGLGGGVLLAGVLGFVAAFAMAMGPVSWIVNSEIFPTKMRGRAMGVSIMLLWFADYVVTQTFPMLKDGIGPAATFWIYAGFSLASLLFVMFCLPETKGKTLEEIEAGWGR